MSEEEVDPIADAAIPEAGPEPERLYGAPVERSDDRVVLHCTRESWYETATEVLVAGYRLGIDLTAVDYLTYRAARALPEFVEAERFEVVACMSNLDSNERLWLKVQVPVDDPVLPSLVELYPGFDFLEREVFDMFGIVFSDHPDLSRILMPEDWQGHPLRKDYSVGAIPVQFKGAPGAR